MTPEEQQIAERIQSLVAVDLRQMPPQLRAWAEQHLVEPRPTTRVHITDELTLPLWLVTDHTGVNDAACRVVYQPDEDVFGLDTCLPDGTKRFMGLYGSFAESVENM